MSSSQSDRRILPRIEVDASLSTACPYSKLNVSRDKVHTLNNINLSPCQIKKSLDNRDALNLSANDLH